MNAEHEHVTVNPPPPPPPPPPPLHPFYCRHMSSNPSSEKLWVLRRVQQKGRSIYDSSEVRLNKRLQEGRRGHLKWSILLGTSFRKAEGRVISLAFGLEAKSLIGPPRADTSHVMTIKEQRRVQRKGGSSIYGSSELHGHNLQEGRRGHLKWSTLSHELQKMQRGVSHRSQDGNRPASTRRMPIIVLFASRDRRH